MRLVVLALASLVVAAAVGCTIVTDSGSASEGCPPDTKECAGSCVPRDDVQYGCGRASCSPCSLTHAVASCSAEGECTVASCVGSWEDCDRESTNGCETNLDSDVENCGACDEPCSAPRRGHSACAEAQCYVRECEEPFFDCNFDVRDGCEVDLSTDEEHCGECGFSCDEGELCSTGACQPGD